MPAGTAHNARSSAAGGSVRHRGAWFIDGKCEERHFDFTSSRSGRSTAAQTWPRIVLSVRGIFDSEGPLLSPRLNQESAVPHSLHDCEYQHDDNAPQTEADKKPEQNSPRWHVECVVRFLAEVGHGVTSTLKLNDAHWSGSFCPKGLGGILS